MPFCSRQRSLLDIGLAVHIHTHVRLEHQDPAPVILSLGASDLRPDTASCVCVIFIHNRIVPFCPRQRC